MMKKSILTILCTAFFVLTFSLSIFAQESITLKGTIIDNKCAEANKANLSNFIKTHPKECAMAPACAASGYAIYTNEKLLMKFDKASCAKVTEFLKKTDSTLKVTIGAKQVGCELNLASIENGAAKPGLREQGEQKLMEQGKEKMMEKGAEEMMKGSKPKLPGLP
jgi:hypothetical protein